MVARDRLHHLPAVGGPVARGHLRVSPKRPAASTLPGTRGLLRRFTDRQERYRQLTTPPLHPGHLHPLLTRDLLLMARSGHSYRI